MIDDAIRQRLADLAARNGGVLIPEAVVEDAKSPDSPYHHRFPWDVNEAAQRHWLEIAREIIRSVKVEVTIEHRQIRAVAYVRDPTLPVDVPGYRAVTELRSEKAQAAQVLEQEFDRVRSALYRTRELAALFDMRDHIESLLAELAGLRKKLKAA